MSTKPSLVFFGNEVLATGCTTFAPILTSLLDDGYPVKAVVLSQGKVTSRAKSEPTISQIAEGRGIPIIESQDQVAGIEADAGVLAAYGRILPPSILNAYPSGIVNIHPSLLPKYRGPTPIEQVILDGLPQTGVSLIKLTAKTDAGPVYAQVSVALNGDETKQYLADELGSLAAKLLSKNLTAILTGETKPIEQDESIASSTKRLAKQQGLIDWSRPAERLERQVRAYAGWPKSRANIHKHDVIITKVRVAQNEADGSLTHKTGDGWLEIEELIAPSGRKMTGSDFLRGYVK